MTAAPYAVKSWTWPSSASGSRTTLRIEGVRIDERSIELAVHAPTEAGMDGPCVDLTPGQARAIARDLTARADLVDALTRMRSVHAEEVPF